MKKTVCLLGVLLLHLFFKTSCSAQFYQGFNELNNLWGDGWVVRNHSAPVGSTSWFQGIPLLFNAESGPDSSYVAANNQAAQHNGGTISDWLLSPAYHDISNNKVVSFYVRTVSGSVQPDRLQFRLSMNDTSTNVGSSASGTGDFTTCLFDINPNQIMDSFPTTWTRFNITLSGLSGTAAGRFAFRYYVLNVTDTTNGSFIGIDSFYYSGYNPASVAAYPAAPSLQAWPNPASGELNLSTQGGLSFPCQLRIYSVNGTQQLECRVEEAAALHHIQVAGLPPGSYFAALISRGCVTAVSFQKQ